MRVVSITLSASVVASLVSSVAASYNNNNESSNPHHHKPRYLAKAAKSSSGSEGSKSNEGSGSKSGKGSKGASTPTIPPSVDTFDDESSSAPTSNPTSAPTTCQLTCNDDTFIINTSGSEEYSIYLGSGDEAEIATATGRDITRIYSGDMLSNDNACGTDELFLSTFSTSDSGLGSTLFLGGSFDNTIQVNKGGFNGVAIAYEACTGGVGGGLDLENCCTGIINLRFNPCGSGAPCSLARPVPSALEGATCETLLTECTCVDNPNPTVGLEWGSCASIPDTIKKGGSEGIGFDPRAFELDEEEDLDFLMSMSMSMRVVDIDEDDVEKEEVVEESEESTTADDNLNAAKSFWGW